MARALSNDEMNELNGFMQKYGEYREVVKGKNAEAAERYFCVKRDDFPEFKDKPALDFWNWVHDVYNLAYGNKS